ncbi:MAG: GGDEF domain-containing protein [Deltaproteobacteria bacterium]|nr:GGDEF domain-containing protein [Deltaproteobacteria bacterium]
MSRDNELELNVAALSDEAICSAGRPLALGPDVDVAWTDWLWRTMGADDAHDHAEVVRLTAELNALRQANADLQRRNAELSRIAQLVLVDGLTGLRNRRCFDERIAEEISRAQRRLSNGFALIMFDLDGLKRCNDTGGHQAGDAMLKTVAENMRRTTRIHDVCCRVGGDEFAVLVPGANAVEASKTAQRVKAALSQRGIEAGFGIAVYGESGTSAGELVAAADSAMYRDKRRHRGDDHRGKAG